jgi:hypothetical protein
LLLPLDSLHGRFEGAIGKLIFADHQNHGRAARAG